MPTAAGSPLGPKSASVGPTNTSLGQWPAEVQAKAKSLFGLGRDIRLATATMRALNSRRPQHLLIRSIAVVLLLLSQETVSRSVPWEEIPQRETSKLTENAEPSTSDEGGPIGPEGGPGVQVKIEGIAGDQIGVQAGTRGSVQADEGLQGDTKIQEAEAGIQVGKQEVPVGEVTKFSRSEPTSGGLVQVEEVAGIEASAGDQGIQRDETEPADGGEQVRSVVGGEATPQGVPQGSSQELVKQIQARSVWDVKPADEVRKTVRSDASGISDGNVPTQIRDEQIQSIDGGTLQNSKIYQEEAKTEQVVGLEKVDIQSKSGPEINSHESRSIEGEGIRRFDVEIHSEDDEDKRVEIDVEGPGKPIQESVKITVLDARGDENLKSEIFAADDQEEIRIKKLDDGGLGKELEIGEIDGSSIKSRRKGHREDGLRSIEIEKKSATDEIDAAHAEVGQSEAERIQDDVSGPKISGTHQDITEAKAAPVEVGAGIDDDHRSGVRSIVENTEEGEPAQPEKIEEQDSKLLEAHHDPVVEEKSGSIGKETEADHHQEQPSPAQREDRFLEPRDEATHERFSGYLGADETQPGLQESIVDGQIRKLISIRDDAIGIVTEQDDIPDTHDSGPMGTRKTLGVQEEIGLLNVETPEEDSNDGATSPIKEQSGNSGNTIESNSRIQRWIREATLLQEQIKNPSFIKRLREQAVEVLPEIPKFTEFQLLDALKTAVSLKTPQAFRESLFNSAEFSTLNSTELEILKCAEQLVAVNERQSFQENMLNCIRGLSVVNCMRIFVFPHLGENLPQNLFMDYFTLPVEINVSDWLNSTRRKNKTSRADVASEGEKFLIPELIVLNILKDGLKAHPDDTKAVSFIAEKNETLVKLLTPGQIKILQLAERFLPEASRKDYSDRMFSCVRRFEYFSCVKYFAWPLVKQYYPTLPSFPDYQSWYPGIPVYPEYPILPFPSISAEVGQLPEIVDADPTRATKPHQDAAIVHILQNTLKAYPGVPTTPSYFSPSSPAALNLITQDQLTAVRMAERLLPVPIRQEFASRTLKCIQQFNYLSCVKYSTWPTIRQFAPELPSFPDFSDWVSGIPDYFGFQDFQGFPGFEGFAEYFPQFPGLQPAPPTQGGPVEGVPVEGVAVEGVAVEGVAVEGVPVKQPAIFLRKLNGTPVSSENLEAKVLKILKDIRDSMGNPPTSPSVVSDRNILVLATITERQLNVVKVAESILPPAARVDLISRVAGCLQNDNDFINCTRYVIWPSVGLYASALPKFPENDDQLLKEPATSGEIDILKMGKEPESSIEGVEEASKLEGSSRKAVREEGVPRNRGEHLNSGPVISVTGTRFVPIFTDHPEAVLLNILSSIQTSAPNSQNANELVSSRTPEFQNFLTEQQNNIIRITETLLPEQVRPIFVSRVLECVRENSFLDCSREVLWPCLAEFYPRLPGFPNFGNQASIGGPKLPPSGSEQLSKDGLNTETSMISEKIGQPGDGTVIITDTRFIPIFSEQPETVILNILRTVQAATPTLPSSASSSITKTPEVIKTLTEQQKSVVQVAESLVPESVKPVFVKWMVECTQNNVFLVCMRDIAWPTIAQFYPRLPSFPNFGSTQGTQGDKPATSVPLEYGNLQQGPPAVILIPTFDAQKPIPPSIIELETTLKSILSDTLAIRSGVFRRNPNLDTQNPAIAALITPEQATIIQLTYSLLPDSAKPDFENRILDCIQSSSFLSCTRYISWPSLKQFIPDLPDFTAFEEYLPETPQYPFPEIPTLPQLPSVPQLPFGETLPPLQPEKEEPIDTSKNVRPIPASNIQLEKELETSLKEALWSHQKTPVQTSYFDTRNPVIAALVTPQQASIIRLTESLLPSLTRPKYVRRIVDCLGGNGFYYCTRNVSWPTLKLYYPSLPSFTVFEKYIPEIPQLSFQEIPIIPEIPNFPQGLGIPSFQLGDGLNLFQPQPERPKPTPPSTAQLEEKLEALLNETLAKNFKTVIQDPSFDPRYPGVAALVTPKQASVIILSESLIPNLARPAYAGRMVRCLQAYDFLSCTKYLNWPTLKQVIPNLPDFSIFDEYLPKVPVFQYPELLPIPELPSFIEPPFVEIPTSFQPQEGPNVTGNKTDGDQDKQQTGPSTSLKPDGELEDGPKKENTTASETSSPSSEIPGYPGQPPEIPLNISTEEVSLPEGTQKGLNSTPPAKAAEVTSSRKRRSVVDLFDSYSSSKKDQESQNDKRDADSGTFPNINESQFLQLLINVSKSKASKDLTKLDHKEYYVDTLNSTLRHSLTADQYEILKLVEDFNGETAKAGFMSKVIQCIRSLSFIRCVGIFVWPMITSNLPSIGLPSVGGFLPLGRAQETEIQDFFGMSSTDFEKELLSRKESIEGMLLDWYKSFTEEKFEKDWGLFRIKGYGNGELGVSIAGSRTGRAKRIKDNKNLPSILTVISDLMEDFFEQNEKAKKESSKKERSMGSSIDSADYQTLKDSDEDERLEDDQLLLTFLDKIQTNSTSVKEADIGELLNTENANDAFEILFGTRIGARIANRLKELKEDHLKTHADAPSKDAVGEVEIVPLEAETEESDFDLRVIPLETQVTYDLAVDSAVPRHSQPDRRQEDTKKEGAQVFRAFLEEHAKSSEDNRRAGQPAGVNLEDKKPKNRSKAMFRFRTKDGSTELALQLPRLYEDIIPRKITSSLIHVGRDIKNKMSQMMPGIGMVVSFLIQMALAHARAAASIAGMVSNMALGSAMFSMIRQSLFGSSQPKIKYVFEEKITPAEGWPQDHQNYYYR